MEEEEEMAMARMFFMFIISNCSKCVLFASQRHKERDCINYF